MGGAKGRSEVGLGNSLRHCVMSCSNVTNAVFYTGGGESRRGVSARALDISAKIAGRLQYKGSETSVSGWLMVEVGRQAMPVWFVSNAE